MTELSVQPIVDIAKHLLQDSKWPVESTNFFSVPTSRRNHPTISSVVWLQFTPTTPDPRWFNKLRCPDGYYMVFGSVSFPELYEDLGLAGFAVLFGFHFASRKLYILSERPFMTIDPGIDKLDAPDPTTRRPLNIWIAACMRYYRSIFFVYQESNQAINKHLPSVYRAFPGVHRPSFLPFPWGDWSTAMTTVVEWQHLDRLRGPTREIYRDLQQFDADPNYQGPALHALCYGVGQLDRMLQRDDVIRALIEETGRHAELAAGQKDNPVERYYR